MANNINPLMYGSGVASVAPVTFTLRVIAQANSANSSHGIASMDDVDISHYSTLTISDLTPGAVAGLVLDGSISPPAVGTHDISAYSRAQIFVDTSAITSSSWYRREFTMKITLA